MKQTLYIYGLHDPRDGALRYVGKATNPTQRLRRHLARSRRGERTHKAAWLRSLLALGLEPTVGIVEKTTERKWQERERFWISHFKAAGAQLTNSTDGGEGGATMKGKKFTAEHRKALSEAFKGHPVAAHVREAVREANTGRTPANKLDLDEGLLREMYLERRMTSYQIAAVFGVNPSPIQMRLRKLGITRNRSEARKGAKTPLETRLKLSKLTPDDARLVRQELERGCNQKQLARRFGVSQQTITNIKQGKRYQGIGV